MIPRKLPLDNVIIIPKFPLTNKDSVISGHVNSLSKKFHNSVYILRKLLLHNFYDSVFMNLYIKIVLLGGILK